MGLQVYRKDGCQVQIVAWLLCKLARMQWHDSLKKEKSCAIAKQAPRMLPT